ncbi:MAG TPA: proline--tRNA ligase [Acidimicrobiales bacterium]|nr:proline--tRNA ligase [Acidimicrobiales bacterium]
MGVVRMSQLLLRTRREDPTDAEVRSHRLLVRAGYIRRVAAGVYTWMPLGLRVLSRVERIVREEMDAIGGQEVRLPALVPAEHFAATGRLDEYGDLLFRVDDRRGAPLILAPTHEELFTELAQSQCSSYRDLPLILYQVQTKYRDEPRPRSGLLRGREFVMKDSYSFDLDDAGLATAYDRHRAAYVRAFARLGLQVVTVSAVSGAMGGSHSEEFLAPADVGEDTYVSCAACGYAANTEAAELSAGRAEASGGDHPPMEELDTPDTPTIESLVAHLGGGITAADTLKNLLVKAGGRVIAVGVPGDRDVDLVRLEAALAPEGVEMFGADDFASHPDLPRGYVGPQNLAALGIPYYADPLVASGTAWVTGANRPGRHVTHAVCGRDFTVDRYLSVATVLPGDPCPSCGEALGVGRGIEVGHIFQLGRKYTDALGFDVTGADGGPVRVTMGSYGLGVSRVVAAVAEQTADDAGLRWPAALAPFDVHVVAVGKGDEQLVAAEQIATGLSDRGDEVLLDDRRAAPGVAFTDADLIGVPSIVIVGRALAEGNVEIKDRLTDTRRLVPVSALLAAGR